MEAIIQQLETILEIIAQFAILMFEYIGVIIIAISGMRGLVNYIKHRPDTRLILAQGLAMGLEFKLGSEILRTVIVRNFQEILIVGGIIVLRATLTILLHWEIKNEKNETEELMETRHDNPEHGSLKEVDN